MKWIITEDHSNESVETEPSTGNAVGCGYAARKHSKDEITTFAETLVQKFRLLDDDGNKLVVGKCEDLALFCGDDAFEPMDRFYSCYGCTSMEYLQGGKWVQL